MTQIDNQREYARLELIKAAIFSGLELDYKSLTGRDWAIRFLPLGEELRKMGCIPELRQLTITDPMDPIAIRALWLAGHASVEGAGSTRLVQLVHVLTSILDGQHSEMIRFQASVQNVFRWVVEHHFRNHATESSFQTEKIDD